MLSTELNSIAPFTLIEYQSTEARIRLTRGPCQGELSTRPAVQVWAFSGFRFGLPSCSTKPNGDGMPGAWTLA